MRDIIKWLCDSGEPWTQYRTLLEIEGKKSDDPAVQLTRKQLLSHPRVQALITRAAEWEVVPLKRHNDAAHPIYALTTLADFGLRYGDPGMQNTLDSLMRHQSEEGAFQTLCNIHPRYGGTGQNTWSWFNCDAPTVLYIFKAMGMPNTGQLNQARDHLVQNVYLNGWRCTVAPELGDFRGPGRKADPCPIANLYALKALIQFPEMYESDAVQAGADVLLWHWEHQKERKIYLFGIGTNFRKLKYPFIWYDVLHVVDVLSQLDYVRDDDRFKEMVTEIALQADVDGSFTASSMYRAWSGWSFADKKHPSPWLTFLVLRILKRAQNR